MERLEGLILTSKKYIIKDIKNKNNSKFFKNAKIGDTIQIEIKLYQPKSCGSSCHGPKAMPITVLLNNDEIYMYISDLYKIDNWFWIEELGE